MLSVLADHSCFIITKASQGQKTTWLSLTICRTVHRSWTSIKENAILYGAIGALGAVGIVILLFMGHLSPERLVELGVQLSNTFGGWGRVPGGPHCAHVTWSMADVRTGGVTWATPSPRLWWSWASS